jgi:hypothetical protein
MCHLFTIAVTRGLQGLTQLLATSSKLNGDWAWRKEGDRCRHSLHRRRHQHCLIVVIIVIAVVIVIIIVAIVVVGLAGGQLMNPA